MKDRKDQFGNYLAVLVLLLCFGYLYSGKFSPISERTESLCHTVILLIVGFFFGSSMGSKRSGETLRQLVNPQDGTTVLKTDSPTLDPKQKRLDELLAITNPSIGELAEIKQLEDELKT